MQNNQPQNQPQNQAGSQQKQLQVADNIPGAEYANAMQTRHNRDEFQLVFFSIFPPSGKVSGKIITSPGHFKRMVKAMQENLQKYEEQYGEIKEAESAGKEIGFQG